MTGNQRRERLCAFPAASNKGYEKKTHRLDRSLVSDSTSKAAQTFVAALPVMIIYPFLQKYFAAGIQLGSVKE